MKTLKNNWSVSTIEGAKYFGVIEFQDNKGEFHDFHVMAGSDRLIFGGAVNVGFIESGYILRGEDESESDTLREMMADLETFYNNGPEYVSRIVVNERM